MRGWECTCAIRSRHDMTIHGEGANMMYYTERVGVRGWV